MCQPCHDTAVRVAPVLIEVPEDHDNYKSGERRVFQLLTKGTDPFIAHSRETIPTNLEAWHNVPRSPGSL